MGSAKKTAKRKTRKASRTNSTGTRRKSVREKPIEKILVANRGEIACRVIKTARALGIKTVAVYSDSDHDAVHVEMADESVHIGPSPANQSYLVIEKIVEAALETGADAVHPGYGFLSENEAFSKALKKAGIRFIGPNVEAIRVMGDKIESKKFAAKAKVNSVPGYLGSIKSTSDALKIAQDIGYPVMIKASAGGGGKGMRIAYSDKDVSQGFESAMSEARSSFGDDRVFIEKYIEEPRHIEIQVLGDKYGNVIYLGERECSIQRRNQKVIEEAPSPFVDKSMRAAMGKQAVALAKAVSYESAGTVEFIVDKDKNFYFLEMNTRLQVEHPVTELVTGLDIVEQMIRVAEGHPLKMKQSDVKIRGWAIESRIYAEDPKRNFLPSIGRLVYYRPPAEISESSRKIRNDTGVEEGSEISLYYDPMIAKLCTYGATRLEAIDLMAEALDQFDIEGINHNIAFLTTVMRQKRFRSGRLTTNYIPEEFPDGFTGAELSLGDRERLAAVAAFVHAYQTWRAKQISGQLASRQPTAKGDWVVQMGEWMQSIGLEWKDDSCHATIRNGGKEKLLRVISNWRPGQRLFLGEINGEAVTVQIRFRANSLIFIHKGAELVVTVRPPFVADLSKLMPKKDLSERSKNLLCPMPGLILSINVVEGQEVKVGDSLVVVEAMKMENILTADRDAKVAKIVAKPGDSLAVDDVIIEFA